MNPNEKPRTFISDPQKLAEDMGEGRMSVSEKAQYLEEHDARFFRNVDFVNVETYRSVLKPILRDGDVVLNVGAGYAIAPTDTVLDSVTAAIQLIDKKVTVVPVDYNHDRTKSWLLLDVEDKEKSDNLELEPVTGSATELPIGTSTVDGYYSVNLINEPRSEGSEKEFVRAAATEAYRVLKPGGFVLISSFGYVWWRMANGNYIYNDNIDEEEMVTKEQVRQILEAVGFVNMNEVPFDETIMSSSLEERLHRKNGAREVGVQEACAFLAFKPGSV